MSDNDLRPTAEWALGRPARSMRYLAEPMSRAIWAEQERDEAEARAEAAEQQAARLRAALRAVSFGMALDGQLCWCLPNPGVPFSGGHRPHCGLARAALAASQPAPAAEAHEYVSCAPGGCVVPVPYISDEHGMCHWPYGNGPYTGGPFCSAAEDQHPRGGQAEGEG